jgi:hypothetical protein
VIRALLLVALLTACASVAAADRCPPGWPVKFTANESELHVIVLSKGTRFCAKASTGFVSGVIVADGERSLDTYLPEDDRWTIVGPPNESVPGPVPTPRPTPRPPAASQPTASPGGGSVAPTPGPSFPSMLPDAAMDR